MTTFTDRLGADEVRNLRHFVTIKGIKHVLQTATNDVPTALIASTRTRVKCVDKIAQDRRDLDMVDRRAKGGGLRLSLVDDDDHTLRDLFSMRRRRASYIAANASAAAVTITVKSTAAFDAAGDFWVGAECISYTGKTATTFTGCTRGVYDTTARALRGGATNGQAVYLRAPSWIGRIVTLKGYFITKEGTGATEDTTTTADTLGTFQIDSPPQYVGDDRWELNAVDRIDGYMKKAIYSSVNDVAIAQFLAVNTAGIAGDSSIPMDDTQKLGVFGSTAAAVFSNDRFVLMTETGRAEILVRGVEVTSTVVWGGRTLVTTNSMPSLNPSIPNSGFTRLPSGDVESVIRLHVSSMRAVAYLTEKADTLALKVLQSRTGDGTHGTYDVLPGRDGGSSTDTEPDVLEWRIGAAIRSSDIDTAAFSAAGQTINWYYFLTKPITVGEFIGEFCFVTDSFMLTTLDGRLSVKSMSDGAASLVSTVIDSSIVIGKAKATYDESNVFPHVVLKCGYSFHDDDFGETIELLDSELGERYPQNDATITLESKSIQTHMVPDNLISAPYHTPEQIRQMLRRYQCEEAGRGALFVEVKCHLDVAMLNLGDIVTLTIDDVPDMEGSTISNRRARVVSHLTDWDSGTVDLRLQVLRPPKRIAPAAIINSTASLDTVLTLSNNAPESGTQSPLMFGAGNAVIVWDVSGNVSHTTTLAAAGAGTVTLAAAPPFAIQGTVDFITLSAATVGDLVQTQNGYTPLTDFIYQVDDDEGAYSLAVPGAGESRWR